MPDQMMRTQDFDEENDR